VSHAAELDDGAKLPEAPPPTGFIGIVLTLLRWIDEAIVRLSMIALLLASAVLTYSAVVRYFFKVPTDWQDEMAVFLLIGVTFMCGGYVQSLRGHVGIQVLAGVLPPRLNQFRLVLVDILSFAFCGFFAWKSWALLLEAIHEGQTTSSTWGAPLWVPYGLMTVGMTLLSVRLASQLLMRFFLPSPPVANP
jgi:TRAP-type C4-dicarboxylate transport system permease small subunit